MTAARAPFTLPAPEAALGGAAQDPTGSAPAAATAGPAAPGGEPPPPASPLPAVSRPKGGGAIRGIGEKFDVNPATGTGTATVPVVAAPGRSGFGPALSLSYDSGAGNGPFGLGWSLGLASIERKTDKGLPRYDDEAESDVFILSGAEDLVPLLDEDGDPVRFDRTVHEVDYSIALYRPRVEGLYARIERWVNRDEGTTHWRTIGADNLTTLYGIDADSRIHDPADPRRTFSFLAARSFDAKGNVMVYDYAREDDRGVNLGQAHEANRPAAARTSQRYLSAIRYGNAQPYLPTWEEEGDPAPLPADWHFRLVFDYGDHDAADPTPARDAVWPVRPDPFSSHRAGFEVRTYRRCERVLQFHRFPGESGFETDRLVRSTDLAYSDESAPADPRNPTYTFVEAVHQRGYRRSGAATVSRELPPL